MIGNTTERDRVRASSEFIAAGFALLALLIAQWMLSTAIHGSNYYGWDGKMAQATILAALEYAGLFDVTNISPIEGIGSQLLTMNVWANPAYWPFAFFDREVATDVSALVAVGVFTTACYIMLRCFDVPVVPSAIAAQLCIALFAPALLILLMPTNFCLTPGNAVVYAPHMVALGLLARLDPGSWRRFGLITVGIFAMLFYSLYVDPLWTMVNGVSWALAFAVVAVSPLRFKTIVLRGVALGCCFILLVISGAGGYLYTLSQYTARVQYAEVIDRPRGLGLVTAVTYSPNNMKYFYLACGLGWLLGLVTLRGRPQVLVVATVVSFGAYVVYSMIYLLLLHAPWMPPIPLYIEQCLCALYIAGAVAGYWGVLRAAAVRAWRAAAALSHAIGMPNGASPTSPLSTLFGVTGASQSRLLRAVTIAGALILVAAVPAQVANYALHDSAPRAEMYNEPWPDEPELMRFFSENVSSKVGEPFRGSIAFWNVNRDTTSTMANVWAHGMHTIDEYSQLVTPQALYFLYAVLEANVTGRMNGFVPYPSVSWENFGRVMQLLGTRYYLTSTSRAAGADQAGYPLITLPRRPVGDEPGLWYIYKLPHPNVGDYSPTEIVAAQSSAEIVAALREPDFDFTRKVVLSTPINEPLVPARDMRMSRIRAGLHVTGHSDGTSLAVLPQQFSHCLRAHDDRVRLVRADLMMTGMIFSGDLDTVILFDYGIFSPRCRRLDLADMKRLDLRIDLRMPHLNGDRMFPEWHEGIAKLRDAWKVIAGQDSSPAPEEPTESSSPPETPSEPAVTQETTLADLPKVTTSGFAWLGVQGLNAEADGATPVVTGQPTLRLVAVPTEGRHYLAAQSTGLDKNRVYRITAWVKAPPRVKVEIEARDGINPRDGKPANYIAVIFDPAARKVFSSPAGLKGRGIERGTDEWEKVWVDLTTMDGQLVLTFGIFNGDRKLFKGDGRLGLTLGGIDIEPRS